MTDQPPIPHAGQPCAVCHDAGTYVFDADIANSKCQSCHDLAAPVAAGGGADKKVDGHFGSTYTDPTTSLPLDVKCVECHNPMRAQTNLSFIRDTIRGNTVFFTATTGAGSFSDGAPYADNICDTCHTQTNHHQGDGTAPGGQDHNNGVDCTGCHTHLDGFQTFLTPPPPHNLITDCTACHIAAPDYVTPVANSECMACHDVSAPGAIAADWSLCRTESGAASIADLSSSLDVALTTPITDVNQAFLLMDISGPEAVAQGRDHMVSGDILDANTLTFQRGGSSGQVEISYAVVECFNNEFAVESGEIIIANGVTSNTATLSAAVDLTKSLVIVNARTNNATPEQYQSRVTGELQDASTVLAQRAATATGSDTTVGYQVVEFSAESTVSVQTGEVTLGSGLSTTATPGVSIADMSSAWLYFSYDATDDGPQQTAIKGQITDPNTLTFARHANNTYTNRIRWYVVEFPTGEVTVQRGSSSYIGGGSATATHNIGFGGVTALDKAFSFVTNTVADQGGTGGGAPFDEQEYFDNVDTNSDWINWQPTNISGTPEGSPGTAGFLMTRTTGTTQGNGNGCFNGGPTMTPSQNTGPCALDSGAGFLFVEASNGTNGDRYFTRDVSFDADLYEPNISFNYSAFGANIGGLYLQVNDGGGWVTEWQQVGDDLTNGAWTSVSVDLFNGGGITATQYNTGLIDLRFLFQYGGNWAGDVSIDTLRVFGNATLTNAFPRNRWTEFMNTTSNIQMSNWRGDTVDANANFEWQVIEFTGTRCKCQF
jgi:hypothetical protein